MNLICINSANLQTKIATKAAAEAVQEQNDSQQVAENLSSCEWYSSIIHFLKNLEVTPGLTLNKARAI